MNNIAVLLTCFNRKDKTIKCLQRIFAGSYAFDVYLVDDGSTDNTAEEVKHLFPQVNVIKGNGNLFWNRGMHLAWATAAEKDYDFYLWLNDDVYLYENFLEEIFETYYNFNSRIIVSGIIESIDKSEILYGGYDANKNLVKPAGESKPITYLNGNIVLVSKEIYHMLGNLDPYYCHDLGDVDYGLRALKKNIKIYSTKVPVGAGEKNPICRERLNNTTITKRFKRLYAPLGSNPKINFYFRKKHKSILNAVTYFGLQHFINIIPDNINNMLFGKRYQ